MTEVKALFGQCVDKADCEVVCGTCYAVLDPANHPHEVEETARHLAAGGH